MHDKAIKHLIDVFMFIHNELTFIYVYLQEFLKTNLFFFHCLGCSKYSQGIYLNNLQIPELSKCISVDCLKIEQRK